MIQFVLVCDENGSETLIPASRISEIYLTTEEGDGLTIKTVDDCEFEVIDPRIKTLWENRQSERTRWEKN